MYDFKIYVLVKKHSSVNISSPRYERVYNSVFLDSDVESPSIITDL